ncbi:hypothetical protein BDV96DRAFT_616965 [Lophiotrema nucula]|uniref:Tetraspanin Tsp3 n=1 Tax=Lophiotrema nucula TaxID=690887 RepID=A0A6A5YKU8_9PLEO|nr:hypothetical protein BDV96DRAFT_616965 [Lophiotrema nucula]
MAYTRKQIVTCISIIYLVLSTALAAFASSRANNLSVPIPATLSGFATALPVVAGIVLEIGYDLSRRQEHRKKIPRGETPRPPLVLAVNTIIFIYSTVVITLLGTHASPPSGLNCGLEQKWGSLFRKKDEEGIRAIQDAYHCCGFVNSHDRAWPFPDKSHTAHACEEAFGRTQGCFRPWKAEEQNMAGILMGVVGLVFLWQMAIITFPMRPTPLHSILPTRVSRFLTDEELGSNRGPQQAIDYLPDFQRYSDRVAEESESEDEPTPQQTLEGGVQQVRGVLTGSGIGTGAEEEHPHPENEWSRN